jgi:uncharacterized protein YfaS (alpha-2-macroglobulin family)
VPLVNGEATLKFTLPDNLTTFRVLAVATGHGPLTGTGDQKFLVTQDLLLRSSLPNAASHGDQFSAGVILTNRSDSAGSAAVTFKAEGLTLLDDSPTQTQEIGPGENREFFFTVEAQKMETATVNFSVTMGDIQDAVEYKIPLHAANALTTETTYVELVPPSQNQALASVKLPEGTDLTRGSLTIDLSPSLVGTLFSPLQWLIDYPYNCLEQTTSKAVGILQYLKMAKRYQIPQNQEAEYRSKVKAQIATLYELNNGGGFSIWPNGSWSTRSVFLTAYVLDFLTEAKNQGFEVDNYFYSSIVNYLNDSLNTDSERIMAAYSKDDYPIVALTSLIALAHAGAPQESQVELFYLDRANLSPLAKIALLRAVAALPPSRTRTDQIQKLIPELVNLLEVSSGKASVKGDQFSPRLWLNDSPDVTSQALLALLEAAPYHNLLPYLTRSVLADANSSQTLSTYRVATLLKALTTYATTLEDEDPKNAYEILSGSQKLLEGTFTSYSDPPVSKSLALTEVGEPLNYNLTGEKNIWATVKLSSALEKPDLTAVTGNNLIVSRDYKVIRPTEGQPGITAFSRGQVVKVSLTFLSTVSRYSIVLEDLVPAGFEVVDFNFLDADQTLLPSLESDDETDDTSFQFWYDFVENKPDRVLIFADSITPGVYGYSYLIRPVTPGTYLTPGPIVFEMYAPENFGRGSGESLTVSK